MPPEISPAAVGLRAPPSLHARLPAPGGTPAPGIAFTPAGDGAVAVVRDRPEHGLRRLVTGLGDVVGLLAVAAAFPLAILAVGIPIALLVRLAMWIGGAR